MIPLRHFQYIIKNLLKLHYNNKVKSFGTFKLMLSFFKRSHGCVNTKTSIADGIIMILLHTHGTCIISDHLCM